MRVDSLSFSFGSGFESESEPPHAEAKMTSALSAIVKRCMVEAFCSWVWPGGDRQRRSRWPTGSPMVADDCRDGERSHGRARMALAASRRRRCIPRVAGGRGASEIGTIGARSVVVSSSGSVVATMSARPPCTPRR